MTDKLYWIWLSAALGAGANAAGLLSFFGDAETVYRSGKDWRLSGALTRKQEERLNAVSPSKAESIIAACEKNGWQCVTYEDEDYPPLLRQIGNPPLVLYVQGSISGIANRFCFGIVGTREPATGSIKIARAISSDLSAGGAVIVSGGALGIDSAAHEGALDVGGTTVAVLGCGLGTRYLTANEELRHRITANGALVSEFPPFTPASRTSFPIRNRIISGMSRGILVVEAGEKSGSIITAEFAGEQGRDVFAVPGNAYNAAYVGANRLLRDGASMVLSADDIFEFYMPFYSDMLMKPEKKPEITVSENGGKKAVKVRKKPDSSLSEDEKAVYAAFESEPMYPSFIAAKSGLSINRVMSALSSLEIEDYITALGGGRYELK